MMTRRSSVITLAGLLASGLLFAGILSAPGPVSAQATQTEIKQKAKTQATKAATKWESLTPEQQKKLQDQWKVAADQAEQKWASMTPEQQQQAIGTAKADASKAKKKWQATPK